MLPKNHDYTQQDTFYINGNTNDNDPLGDQLILKLLFNHNHLTHNIIPKMSKPGSQQLSAACKQTSTGWG